MNSELLLDPTEYISNIIEDMGYGKGLGVSHIDYDNSINDDFQYHIRKEATHDGTVLFTNRLINESLLRLINKETYCKDTISSQELSKLKDIEYTIGDIKLETNKGVKTKFGAGIKQTVNIPVKVKYIY